MAQSNSSSPYSAYGIGLLRGDVLPHYRALGSTTTGMRSLNTYSSNINIANPASYSAVGITTMDAGIYMNRTTLSRDGVSESSGNFALGHLAFAIPIKKSAISFGLLPFSDMGYTYAQQGFIDTVRTNQVYSGEGGLSKAYFGYGMEVWKHLSLGANVSYVFGTLSSVRGVEIPNELGALNTRFEDQREISGLSYDFGAQYYFNLSDRTEFTIGYTYNPGQGLSATASHAETRSRNVVNDGEITGVLDTLSYQQGAGYTITMPRKHSVGISYNRQNKFVLGAEFRYADWSRYREGTTNPGFNNAYGASLGFQITPSFNSTRYLSVIDYRLGLRYDKTYMNINNQDITDMAISAGMGLPILSNNPLAIYRINFSLEYGQRGKATQGLVRDNYFNFNLAFVLNDRWFQRFTYD